jgi:hypothetical protein
MMLSMSSSTTTKNIYHVGSIELRDSYIEPETSFLLASTTIESNPIPIARQQATLHYQSSLQLSVRILRKRSIESQLTPSRSIHIYLQKTTKRSSCLAEQNTTTASPSPTTPSRPARQRSTVPTLLYVHLHLNPNSLRYGSSTNEHRTTTSIASTAQLTSPMSLPAACTAAAVLLATRAARAVMSLAP